jgi:hypothetical protein
MGLAPHPDPLPVNGERESTEFCGTTEHQIYETRGVSIVMAGLVPAIHGLAAVRRGCAGRRGPRRLCRRGAPAHA